MTMTVSIQKTSNGVLPRAEWKLELYQNSARETIASILLGMHEQSNANTSQDIDSYVLFDRHSADDKHNSVPAN